MDPYQKQALKRPIVIKYTLVSAAMLIGYFLVLVFSGFLKYGGLRLINYLLIAVALYLAFSEFKRKNHPHILSFLGGLGMGFIIILASDIIFSFFIMVYGFINPSFINDIWRNPFYNNESANVLAMTVYMFSETLFIGIILDIIVLTFLKRGDPSPEELSD
jgi:lysylphosphatidylglycerol synthetase-like protein (DUF2156 family)